MKLIGVLGAGAWGLALADYAARQGHSVKVWDRDKEILSTLRTKKSVGRPKGLIVHPSVRYCDWINDAVQGVDIILSVVPSFAIRDMCHALKPLTWSDGGAVFVNCSKGIEEDTHQLPCDVFGEEIGNRSDLRYGVLAGPSHAEEVSIGVPTAVVASASNRADAELIQTVFNSSKFRVYLQNDYRGVEIGGALKNVLAIVVGISNGKGYGDNAKAALITRGVAETGRLAKAIGANPETVTGLSGLGDLIVTAMSKHSRNRSFGELIASGYNIDEALKRIGAVVEGFKTTRSAYELASKYQVDMPLVTAVYKVIYEGLSIEECISMLLDRETPEERLS